MYKNTRNSTSYPILVCDDLTTIVCYMKAMKATNYLTNSQAVLLADDLTPL